MKRRSIGFEMMRDDLIDNRRYDELTTGIVIVPNELLASEICHLQNFHMGLGSRTARTSSQALAATEIDERKLSTEFN